MKTQLLFLALFSVVIVTACSDGDKGEDLTDTECNYKVITSLDLYEKAPDDPLSITDLAINGDCLMVTFNASGCDGSTWEPDLIDAEHIMESLPPQRSLRLSLKNKELCTGMPTKTLTFDISKLQLTGTNEVYLNIANSKSGILYSY